MKWVMNMYDNGENILHATDEDVAEYVEDKPDSWVYAGEHGWVNQSQVSFVDISEDLFGNDIMAFEFKGRVYESNIVTGSRPE